MALPHLPSLIADSHSLRKTIFIGRNPGGAVVIAPNVQKFPQRAAKMRGRRASPRHSEADHLHDRKVRPPP